MPPITASPRPSRRRRPPILATGIDCGLTCSATFSYATPVMLTASPAASSVFAGWTGDCWGMEQCVVTMFQARGVTAICTLTTVTPTVPTATATLPTATATAPTATVPTATNSTHGDGDDAHRAASDAASVSAVDDQHSAGSPARNGCRTGTHRDAPQRRDLAHCGSALNHSAQADRTIPIRLGVSWSLRARGGQKPDTDHRYQICGRLAVAIPAKEPG
jgi:hypothetical protein